jgi:AcrR family transcriptional regulator
MDSPKEKSTKERLLSSGSLLFGEKGYSQVSVREICKHAHTSMNMIHHYFGSKEGLYEAIVDHFDTQLFAMPIKLLDKSPRSKEDFQARIEWLFETTLDAYLANKAILVLVDREQPKLDSLIEFSIAFKDFIEQAKQLGFARKELDAEMVLGFMLDRIHNQVQFLPWIKKNHGLDIENDKAYRTHWCAANVDLFMNGIAS